MGEIFHNSPNELLNMPPALLNMVLTIRMLRNCLQVLIMSMCMSFGIMFPRRRSPGSLGPPGMSLWQPLPLGRVLLDGCQYERRAAAALTTS